MNDSQSAASEGNALHYHVNLYRQSGDLEDNVFELTFDSPINAEDAITTWINFNVDILECMFRMVSTPMTWG